VRDEADNVRYFSLHALVHGLGERTPEMADICWRILSSDSDESVRHVAASGLGRIYFGQKRKDIFRRLADQLRSKEQTGHMKGGVYNAMHELAGCPPSEWPLAKFPRRVFEDSDIDWTRVAALEDAME
jgi:hypothetical protein